jgi:hypothetical protein
MMATRKKTDVVQLSKIRMREALRARLARDAERKGITLNGEIVERLEQSYANEEKELRDSGILDMMLMNNDLSGALVRNMAIQLAKNPNWPRLKAAKELLEILSSGEEPQPGDDK